jgi:hypothetical protein
VLLSAARGACAAREVGVEGRCARARAVGVARARARTQPAFCVGCFAGSPRAPQPPWRCLCDGIDAKNPVSASS